MFAKVVSEFSVRYKEILRAFTNDPDYFPDGAAWIEKHNEEIDSTKALLATNPSTPALLKPALVAATRAWYALLDRDELGAVGLHNNFDQLLAYLGGDITIENPISPATRHNLPPNVSTRTYRRSHLLSSLPLQVREFLSGVTNELKTGGRRVIILVSDRNGVKQYNTMGIADAMMRRDATYCGATISEHLKWEWNDGILEDVDEMPASKVTPEPDDLIIDVSYSSRFSDKRQLIK